MNRRRSRAFTMVELLVVILIIAILMALLVPAIVGAIRTVRGAQVSSEIQGLGTALNQFKTTYNDFPPSRVYLNEAGFFPVNESTSVAAITGVGSDTTVGVLAQRSLRYMQKFWPRCGFTSVQPASPSWAFDFNGNASFDVNTSVSPLHGGYILQGHQCLVFFLGGVPNNTGAGIGMTGFGKNPVNPFTHANVNVSALFRGLNPSSTTPFFEFKASRLVFDPNDTYGMPGYVDPMGTIPPAPGSSVNFYAYFSSYGQAYDPNDVNFPETDLITGSVLGASINVAFPTQTSGGANNGIVCTSPTPNPYTASLAMPGTGTAIFQSPNTFQIISSGLDGLYGIGGQYTPTGQNNLPFDPASASTGAADPNVRLRENDNLTNFATSKLGS